MGFSILGIPSGQRWAGFLLSARKTTMKDTRQNHCIKIADTTLRDGEQAPGCHLKPEQKMEIARQLRRMKVDVIEAGFPISSPAEFESVKTIAREVGVGDDAPVICAFGRSKLEDIDACWQAVRAARRPRIHTFLPASDLHLQHKMRMTRSEALRAAVQGVRWAKERTSDVQFTPEDSSRADRAYLAEVVEAVIDAGATTVNIADTVGYTTPVEFQALLAFLRSTVRNIDRAVISVHCHDDLGMAVANSLMAVLSGARQVEGTINGIGERAGNCALEEVIMALRTRADFFEAETGIDSREIYAASRLVARHTVEVPPNKSVVGRNAFAHASGIHQDGMLKNVATYEIMKPEDIGAPASTLPLTNRSGRRAVENKLRAMGYAVSGPLLDELFRRFKSFADTTRFVGDEDLAKLVRDVPREIGLADEIDLK